MPTVKEIIATKGSTVWSIDKNATVREAAIFMRDHKIGGVIVTDDGRYIGMFTERDLLKRVVAEGLDPTQVVVGDVMTSEVVCGSPATTVAEARSIMRDRRIRHLPILDGERQLLGLVSIGDLNAFQLADQEQTLYLLNEYLHGRV